MFLHHGTYRVKFISLADARPSVNPLRHVTYREREPWVPEEDLVLTKTLGERIKYVRTNLVGEDDQPMTQPELARVAGLKRGHHGVMRWEKGEAEPRATARERIAALAGSTYRPEVFSRSGAEELVVESAVPRLRSLEARAERAERSLRRILRALDKAGIAVPADRAASRSPASAPQRRAGTGTDG